MRIYTYKTPEKTTNQKKRGWSFKSPFRGRWNWKKIFTFLFRLAAVGIIAIALLFLYYSKDLPDPNKLLARNIPESTKIFARDGTLLYEIHGEYKRTQVNLDQISSYLKNATIAIEDKDFYKHHGISFTGIARATFRLAVNLDRSGGGGSTITQQLVKNSILVNQDPWDRKPRELILSIAMESRFTKDEILRMYLNEIPYGRNAYGIEAASQTYFGKSAKDLSLAESAYLAALPQSPSRYNPFGPNRDILDGRKDYIITQMREQGYINEQEEKEGKEAKVEFTKIKSAISAPHFVLMVQSYLASKYGETKLQEGGLKVYTTLDPRLQEIAEKAVKEGVEKASKKYNANNAGLVAIDPKTGQILAMVGSKDYFAESLPEGCTPGARKDSGKSCLFEPNVNVALAERQPGSSIKPYIYVTAFGREFKYAPATMLMDVPTNFGKYGNEEYKPTNYNGKSYGPLSMRKALAGSLNVPAVKTLALIGVENAIQTARDLGITSAMSDCGLSLVLGGCEVKLLDHTAAMSVVANMGVKNEKTAILKIEDKNGQIIEEYKSDPKTVLDPQAAYELISIMTDNNARSYIFGANSPLILPGRILAAKTGTSQKWHDGWTMGFTPSLATGVWAGNNDGTLMKAGADGVLVAAPIWNQFMKEALAGTPAEEFVQPEGIKKVVVDEVSGKLPTEHTPSTKSEIFADYSIPKDYDDVHIPVDIDSLTGQPADSLTPPERIIRQVFTIFHSEKPENPDWENPVVAWALANGYTYPNSNTTPSPLPPGNGQNFNVEILEPSNETTISQLPFKVIVSASAQNPIARVDLYLDGQFVQSSYSSPYIFEINKELSDGLHTVAVKATDATGATADSSVSIFYAFNAPLTITDPDAGATVAFPLNLTAESGNFYDQVTFYYQPASGNTKTAIPGPANISHPSDKYQYSITWQTPLPAGTYRIYAQTSSGIISPKIKIIVP